MISIVHLQKCLYFDAVFITMYFYWIKIFWWHNRIEKTWMEDFGRESREMDIQCTNAIPALLSHYAKLYCNEIIQWQLQMLNKYKCTSIQYIVWRCTLQRYTGAQPLPKYASMHKYTVWRCTYTIYRCTAIAQVCKYSQVHSLGMHVGEIYATGAQPKCWTHFLRADASRGWSNWGVIMINTFINLKANVLEPYLLIIACRKLEGSIILWEDNARLFSIFYRQAISWQTSDIHGVTDQW